MYESVLSPSAPQLPGADPSRSVVVNFSHLRLTPFQYVIHATATKRTCYMILDGEHRSAALLRTFYIHSHSKSLVP